MTLDDRPTYQVVASGGPSAHTLRAKLSAAPFTIGSGDKVDLKLEGATILPLHARLVVTSKGQVLLINLGAAGTIRLDGEPMNSFTPAYWKPGLIAQLDEYQLQLVALDIEGKDGHLERVRPAVITQDTNPVQEQPVPSFVIDWGPVQVASKPAEPPAGERQPTPPAQGTMLFSEEEIFEEDTRQHEADGVTESMPITPEPSTARPESRQFDSAPESRELRTTPLQPFPYDVKAYVAAPPSGSFGRPLSETLPKDWHQAGRLSGQLTINPANLVAGERVRIPVSVRNGYDYPVHLRVYTAGLPRDWVLAPDEPIPLAPGEISAFDIIIRTRVPAPDRQAELAIRLSDPSSPELVLMLHLQVVFKDAPNISGWLEPEVVGDGRPVYLHVQNQAQATVTVFAAGHSERGLHVIPLHTQLEIPPGQIVKVPVRIDVEERPTLRPLRRLFAVSVTQGNRAPLDFPGTLWVRPRVPLVPAALLLAAIALVAVIAGRSLLAGQQRTPTPTGVPILTSTPAITQQLVVPAITQPTATPTVTPTVIPSSTPTSSPTSTTPPPTDTPTQTPTEVLPFIDPRRAGCNVPIPDGWEPYTVKHGDRVFRLAVDRGTTVDQIAAVNCLSNPRVLYAGDVLLLPDP